MQRYTNWQEEKQRYEVDSTKITADGARFYGQAIQRLAQVENLYEQLQQERVQVIDKLEQMRQAGKNKTATFQQLLAKKLTLGDLLSYFDIYIDEKEI